MKKTRRIEVIRYSRRFSEFTNDDVLKTRPTAEQAAIDVLLQMPEAIPVAAEEIAGADHETDPDAICTVPHSRFPKLFDWLQTKLSWPNPTGAGGVAPIRPAKERNVYRLKNEK